MKNADRPVHPVINQEGVVSTNENYLSDGKGKYYLTKREYFAGLAMQTILDYSMKNEIPTVFSVTAVDAVTMADELLKELDK